MSPKSITTNNAENVPKARIGITSDIEVATKADAVVKEVMKIALEARRVASAILS